jgi:hypothetical protein
MPSQEWWDMSREENLGRRRQAHLHARHADKGDDRHVHGGDPASDGNNPRETAMALLDLRMWSFIL